MNCPARMLSTQYLSQTERCSSESTAAALYPFAKNRSASATPPRTSCESSICGVVKENIDEVVDWDDVVATTLGGFVPAIVNTIGYICYVLLI